MRASRTRRCLLVPAILAVAAAQAPGSLARREPSPATVVSEPGLDVESVTAIFQDRAGFLWIGSRAGLILYDGYASIVFDHEPPDPASLSDNAIRTVFEDRRGFLWVGTNAGGLDRLDRASWTFEHHRHDASDRASLGHDSVYAVVEDRDGKLWVGTQGGLNRLDPTTGRFAVPGRGIRSRERLRRRAPSRPRRRTLDRDRRRRSLPPRSRERRIHDVPPRARKPSVHPRRPWNSNAATSI